ncbi:MAG: type IV pilus secretin PilQ [Ketobacteraceae bacterium]|nr:type IV pilus secretin PilQ [Ketobacteraceae bacterium]
MALLSNVAWAAKLTGIETAALPGDAIELKLKFDATPPSPAGYTIESPARIALDLQGVSNGLAEKYHALGNGNVRSATIMGAGDRTRVIVNLTSLVNYTTKVDGNNLLVTIGNTGSATTGGSTASSEDPQTQGVAMKKKASPSQPTIEELDFRRGESGEGQIMITVSDPSAPVDMREEGGKVVVEFIGVNLPEALHRRLDVVDFATPVKIIDAISESGNARVAIEAKGDYEYLAYQTDKVFTVSVKPIAAEELERQRKERFQFTGEKLSLNFQDIEVRSVLQLIADFTELNLVASDTVNGRITLRLQNVPWDQALDLILKTKGLDKRQVGNVMLVAPADEIAAREKLELEASKQVEELAPIRTEYITVNYAKAEEIASLLTAESGFLTDRGSVSVDQRTNTMVVQDTSAKLDEIRYMLEKLDIPVRQVMIEARIVIANSDASEELGVRWNLMQTDFDVDSNGNIDSMFLAAGRGRGIEESVESILAGEGRTFGTNTLGLDFGVAGSAASSLSLGFWDSETGLIDLELSVLESDGKADIVSTPKVLTADQQKARIASGEEIPYQEASSSGATSTSFKEAVLSLEATPHITPDGRIIMELIINQDQRTDTVLESGVPVIAKNEIETSVIVDNGQTVVLGGVFTSEESTATLKTPFLGDLPFIGRLFKKELQSSNKSELLVFITPKIVTDVLANN